MERITYKDIEKAFEENKIVVAEFKHSVCDNLTFSNLTTSVIGYKDASDRFGSLVVEVVIARDGGMLEKMMANPVYFSEGMMLVCEDTLGTIELPGYTTRA